LRVRWQRDYASIAAATVKVFIACLFLPSLVPNLPCKRWRGIARSEAGFSNCDG